VTQPIETTINLVQDFNRSIKNVEHAPPLRDYPPIVDTQHGITALTSLVPGMEISLDCCNYVILPLEVQVLYKPINQGEYSDNGGQLHCLLDEFIEAYRDDDAYPVEGVKTFQASPEIAMVNSSITPQTIGLIERPVQSGRFYYGFAVRFSVQAAMDCD